VQQIPVQRAQSFYTPPPRERPDAWDQVPPAERVWRWYEQQMQRRVVPPAGVLLGSSVFARLNHNRWVADCVCGSAQVVTPDDARFACPECGYGWVPITFPEKPGVVEAEVAAWPPHERNWWHPADAVAWDRPRPPGDPGPDRVKDIPPPAEELPVEQPPGKPADPVGAETKEHR
jgi:hypothetical protein